MLRNNRAKSFQCGSVPTELSLIVVAELRIAAAPNMLSRNASDKVVNKQGFLKALAGTLESLRVY